MTGIDALTGNFLMDGLCIIGGFVLGVLIADRRQRSKALKQKKIESMR